MLLTQKEAFFLFKNLQYQLIYERYEKSALAGSEKAWTTYMQSTAELDYIYGDDHEELSPEEIERSILDGRITEHSIC